jgi:hypothetical protein
MAKLHDERRQRSPNLGRLGIAIEEHLVEKIIGQAAIDEVKKPYAEKQIVDALGEARRGDGVPRVAPSPPDPPHRDGRESQKKEGQQEHPAVHSFFAGGRKKRRGGQRGAER